MRRVVFNQKGGVGKSTITCNLAAVSAQQGLRTLVLDLDAQGNSTRYLLGAQADTLTADLAGFFDQTLKFNVVATNGSASIDATALMHDKVTAVGTATDGTLNLTLQQSGNTPYAGVRAVL